jgi:hypothetical protein
MKTSEDFQAFYRSDLLSVIDGLEGERKKTTKRVYWAIAAIVALFVIQLTISIASGDELVSVVAVDNQGKPLPGQPEQKGSGGFGLILLSAAVGGLGYYFWFLPKSKELKSRFKSEVIGKMVKFVDPSLEYHPSSGISRAEFEQSKIFLTSGDRFMCEDLVKGTLQKTPIRFSEVHTQKRERSNGDSSKESWVTLFKGMMFIADFNKHFHGRTVVLTDQAEKTFGSLGTMFQKMNSVRDPLIKFENVDFEKAFAVYGTDPIEAHYILSPALMERIMSLKTLMGSIQLSFVESSVFVSIPTRKNFFEARIFSKFDNYQMLESYHRQLQLVTGIVENLNLNTRIWTKE